MLEAQANLSHPIISFRAASERTVMEQSKGSG